MRCRAPCFTFRRRSHGREHDLISRRFLNLVAGAALLAALAGCTRKTATTVAQKPAPAQPFKIGIMTGTVSRAEQDFRAGEQVERGYPGRVRHVTYPDDFPMETETVIAQLAGLAADPEVRVIVVGQAIPGSATAARRIREARPDVLVGFVDPHEDPDSVGAACDLAIQLDESARGVAIVATAQKMGATSLVHYSFPRHMSRRLMAERRDIMARECERRGMRFRPVTAPDPAGEGGFTAAQQFVLEDIPRQLDKLGPATAFFGTDDAMQEPMIKAILEARAGYFVEQDAPASTEGFPAALGIRIPPDRAGDMVWMDAQIRHAIAERGMNGHFGTWSQPADMVAIRAVASLLVDAVQKKTDFRDSLTVREYVEVEAGGPGVRLRRLDPARGNQWLMLLDHVTY